jgi:hypothetical protein
VEAERKEVKNKPQAVNSNLKGDAMKVKTNIKAGPRWKWW